MQRETARRAEEEIPTKKRPHRQYLHFVLMFIFVSKCRLVARHPWLPRPPSLNSEPCYTGASARARHLSTVLSPAIPCPSFCRWGGGKAWAGLLEMRGSGALPGPLSHDGGGIAGPGPRLPGGCPQSSRAVPDTCEYQGGYISGLGGFGL